jgi:deoxyribodipyrimidine photo-lyase
MRTFVVLFTRDLRVADNPALHAACSVAEQVVPLFVQDPAVPSSPNRQRFLAESLADLRQALRRRGADLVVRRGDPVAEAVRVARSVAAFGIGVAADASGYAVHRQRRLEAACATDRLALGLFDSVTVVPPGALRPSGAGDHYRVFTPYWRAWQGYRRRHLLPAPRRIAMPGAIAAGPLPAPASGGSTRVLPGGESAAQERLATWRVRVGGYAEDRDRLSADATSRLSAYLHFGCVSAPAVAAATHGSTEFLRQLCWRDFYQQVLAGFPALGREPFRPGAGESWVDDPEALAAWHAGQTGVPIVDAGMRQLGAEGFMPNRARLIAAAFLTKQLGLDWRAGARWFSRWLLDADVANNYGNWQWVAGTGPDTRRRQFNPLRQAQRFDPDGAYVRRWVPELAGVPGAAVHQPWRLPGPQRRRLAYRPPRTLVPERTG